MDKKQLRIVFLGTPEFAVESLDAIVKAEYNVVGVVTMPDKPAGRGHKMYHSPVKEYALAHNLPLLQPQNLKDEEFLTQLRSLEANLFVVIAFRMLPRQVWQMPSLGTFNLHASLLPRYRGAAPINWAVINGDTTTGVTTFMLKHEIDTGDILGQEQIAIGPDDNVGDVHDALMHLGAKLTLRTLSDIVNDTLRPIPQASLLQGNEPTSAPKIFKDTCHIKWEHSAQRVHDLVRGLSPYPGAWAELIDASNPDATMGEMKILKTRIVEERTERGMAAPGTVHHDRGRLKAVCGDGKEIEILLLQPAGKKIMEADAYLRGAHLPSDLIMG